MDYFKDQPKYYKALSLKLYDVLEGIGATDEFRSLMRKEWTAGEKLESLAKGSKYMYSAHVFGSAYEGSQTRGMHSDVDTVYVDEGLPVINKIGQQCPEKCLLLIQDQRTPPGYVKLQFVKKGTPLTDKDASPQASLSFIQNDHYKMRIDRTKRLICTFKPSKRILKGSVGRNGPALTQIMNRHIADKDVLFAVRSNQLPDCTNEWFTRERRHNWPSKADLEACRTMGCLFVPVGHPHSDEQEMQWRISLSHQERFLVTKFTSVQLKCFILLKLLKKETIPHFMKEDSLTSSLTSYHCKTCMLFMIENTPCDVWQPENLLAVFVSCLKQIMVWTQNGVCPNYFIPSENMFERRVHGLVREELHQVMQLLTATSCPYLLHIKADNFGRLLESSITSRPNGLNTGLNTLTKNNELQKMDLKYTHLQFVLKTRNALLHRASNKSADVQYQNINKEQLKLNTMLEENEQSDEATSRAITLVKAYLKLSQVSTKIATDLAQQKSTQSMQTDLTSDIWNVISLRTDQYSSRLKQASHLCAFGQFQESLTILSKLGDPKLFFSFCYCNQKRPAHPVSSKFKKSELSDISIEEHLYRHLVPCVAFSMCEKGIIPGPLFEVLFRTEDEVHPPSEITHQTNRKPSDETSPEIRHNLAFVDGLFLLNFLLYLSHSALEDMKTHAEYDIQHMDWIIKKWKIGHKETALNLLGWIYGVEGKPDLAANCFCNSLDILPENNAATWHLMQMPSLK